MTSARIVHVFDESEKGLEYAVWLLGVHRLWTRGSGLELREHGDRNSLLASIAAEPGPSLALIDLQADERLDQDYSGHRIIETIRYHPELASRCRPLAFTVHARESVVELARAAGAYGLISKEDLELPEDRVAELDLAGQLRDILAAPALDRTVVAPFRLIPGEVGRVEDEDEIDARVRRYFRADPGAHSKRYFWDLVRYLADGIDKASIAHWIAEDYDVSERAVMHDIEEMGRFASTRYRTRGPQLTELSRDLLVDCPSKRRPPTPDVTIRMLHRLAEVRHLAHDPEVVKASWIDAEALQAVRRLSRVLAQREQTLPARIGQWAYTDQLREDLAHLEPEPPARERLQAALIRGVNALYDASLGLPSAQGR
jgi:DNA-binding NarL/FixJ family response regulator